METVPVVRRNVVIGAGVAGLLVLGSLLLALNVASGDLHWNDVPFLSQDAVDPNSLLAEGRALHCSGIETMAPAAALATLKAEGFAVRIYHERTAASSEHVKEIPKSAVLQDVAAAPGSTNALMFVMTPEHPRFDEGYIGYVPPQHC